MLTYVIQLAPTSSETTHTAQTLSATDRQAHFDKVACHRTKAMPRDKATAVQIPRELLEPEGAASASRHRQQEPWPVSLTSVSASNNMLYL